MTMMMLMIITIITNTLSNMPRQDLSFFITLGVIPSSFSYLPQFQNNIISILQLVQFRENWENSKWYYLNSSIGWFNSEKAISFIISSKAKQNRKKRTISSYCFNLSPELIDSHEMRNQSHSIPAICWNLVTTSKFAKKKRWGFNLLESS